MYLHPLDPSVKCPYCGKGALVFVRTRVGHDLYRCLAEIPCRSYTVHSRRGGICGIGTDTAVGMVSLTWVQCVGLELAKGKEWMMLAKRTDKDISLANSLREAGRRFMEGKPIDIAALFRLIEAHRDQWPQMCARLTNLIQAAQHDATQGNRDSALEYFRTAIQLAENPSRAKGW